MINIDVVKKELNKRGYDVDVKVMEKNGVKMNGIMFNGTESSVAPIIYPRTSLNDLNLIVDDIIKTYNNSICYLENNNFMIDDYDDADIYIAVQSKVENPNYLTKDFLDLQVYMYVEIDDNRTAKVTQELVDFWDVSVDEVWEEAYYNTEANLMSRNLSDILLGTCESSTDKHTQFVLSNIRGFKGASYILFPDELNSIYAMYGNDFYIIPSSIHELLTLSEKVATPNEVREIIKEVNDNEVSRLERLSYNVYKYDHVLNAVVML